MHPAFVSLLWIARVVFALYAFDLLVSVAGLLPMRRPRPRPDFTARFAVLVCAHNEQNVVGEVIASLFAQDYPRAAFEVFVVADHCSDATAERARAAGATVLVREGQAGRTKGYALQWGIDRIAARGDAWDALCVVDADNLVAADFLATMRDHLAAGHCAVQAYLDTKNPDDTWVTRGIALSYFVTNRFWLRARARLHLCATLGGTGWCMAWRLVGAHRWKAESLADDLELTMELIRDGIHVVYTPHTRIWDEKPRTLREALRQRTRWLQGHHDVALRWTGRMLWASLRRGSIRCFDAVLHLLQPMRLLLATAALLGLAALAALGQSEVRTERAESIAWAVPLAVFVLYPLVLAAAEGQLGRALRTLVPCMLFSLTWIPASFVGLLRVRRRVWTHTPHVATGALTAAETCRAAPTDPSASTRPS